MKLKLPENRTMFLWAENPFAKVCVVHCILYRHLCSNTTLYAEQNKNRTEKEQKKKRNLPHLRGEPLSIFSSVNIDGLVEQERKCLCMFVRKTPGYSWLVGRGAHGTRKWFNRNKNYCSFFGWYGEQKYHPNFQNHLLVPFGRLQKSPVRKKTR